MKSIIFTIVAVFVSIGVFAQAPCTPDSTTYPYDGLHPSTLPDAKAGTAYSQTINFKFPKDTATTYQGFGVTVRVDSITIDSARHLPASFTYACGNKTCTYPGGKYGCVQITGNPTSGEIGTHDIEVYYTAFVTETQFGIPIVLHDSGKIAFKIDAGSGIFNAPANNMFTISPNFPNPFNHSTEIEFNAPGNVDGSFSVSNELGQKVYTQQVKTIGGQNTILFERNALPAGMYFYSLQFGNDIVTSRMVIKD